MIKGAAQPSAVYGSLTPSGTGATPLPSAPVVRDAQLVTAESTNMPGRQDAARPAGDAAPSSARPALSRTPETGLPGAGNIPTKQPPSGATPAAETQLSQPATETQAMADSRPPFETSILSRQYSGPAAPLATETLRQIATQIAAPAQQQRAGSVELTLKPVELGHVRLSLNPGEGTIAVAIQADRPETLDLIRRHIDILAQDLREMGYSETSFSFAGGGQRRQADNQPESLAGHAQPETRTIPDPDMPAAIKTDRIDIRL